MPQMGVSVAEGTVVEWKKQVGDWVEADEIIASISTDKIDTDVESPATGRVAEIVVDVGETVDVGTVMARIATDAKPGEPHQSENGARHRRGRRGARGARRGRRARRATTPSKSRRYSPVVMRMAAEHNLDLSQIEGTGRGGRVSKKDVLAFMEGGARRAADAHRVALPARRARGQAQAQAAPAAGRGGAAHADAPARARRRPAPAGGQPLSRMRQAIGSRMVQSLQTAATCTTIAEADMSRIEVARKAAKMSYLPFQARATIETLLEFPALNATLEDDDAHRLHRRRAPRDRRVSLGSGGLIVPIIRDAQDLSVEGLAKRIKDLAVRARNNQLKPDEVSGGTFTITNPGGYGSIMATPVINLPQVGILDTEAVVKRPVVVTDELGNDSIAIRHMTYLCMSWDHRALDGALAAQFLSALRKKLESWPIS